jgi:hypothetical protein
MSIFGEVTHGEGPAPTGFTLGAFLLPGVFLLAYGRFGTFIMFVASGILLGLLGAGGVLLGLIVSFGTAIYCGVNAKEIAWKTGRFATHEDLERSMGRWNMTALVLAVLAVFVFLAASV